MIQSGLETAVQTVLTYVWKAERFPNQIKVSQILQYQVVPRHDFFLSEHYANAMWGMAESNLSVVCFLQVKLDHGTFASWHRDSIVTNSALRKCFKFACRFFFCDEGESTRRKVLAHIRDMSVVHIVFGTSIHENSVFVKTLRGSFLMVHPSIKHAVYLQGLKNPEAAPPLTHLARKKSLVDSHFSLR